jgi:DNA-binding IclR family transcriptional regulator
MKKPRRSAKSTRGNSTILIGLEVIQALTDLGGPSSLGAVAARTQLSSSRAYRYLRALVDGGFVTQDKSSGHYDLGIGILHLGLSAIGRVDPVRHALPIMHRVTEQTGFTTVLSLWGSNGPTVIRCENGTLDMSLKVREGANLSLLSTATGKVFLAYMPEKIVEPFLKREIALWNAHHPRKEMMTKAKVDAMRKDVRRRGLSSTLGYRNPTANICAPIFDSEGRIRLAMSIISVIGQTDLNDRGETAKILLAATRDVSFQIGFGSNRGSAVPN